MESQKWQSCAHSLRDAKCLSHLLDPRTVVLNHDSFWICFWRKWRTVVKDRQVNDDIPVPGGGTTFPNQLIILMAEANLIHEMSSGLMCLLVSSLSMVLWVLPLPIPSVPDSGVSRCAPCPVSSGKFHVDLILKRLGFESYTLSYYLWDLEQFMSSVCASVSSFVNKTAVSAVSAILCCSAPPSGVRTGFFQLQRDPPLPRVAVSLTLGGGPWRALWL
jgi:hypothetical protein